MRSIIFVSALLIGSAALVFAGPYGVGGGADRCPGLLANNVYKCIVHTEGAGGTSTDCFRFAGGSPKFGFTSDLLGTATACTCKPGGSDASPEFNASPSFTCTTDLGVSFDGKVNKDGSISDGSVTNAVGTTYAFSCTRDDACTPQ